jgi:hypothetical protein
MKWANSPPSLPPSSQSTGSLLTWWTASCLISSPSW